MEMTVEICEDSQPKFNPIQSKSVGGKKSQKNSKDIEPLIFTATSKPDNIITETDIYKVVSSEIDSSGAIDGKTSTLFSNHYDRSESTASEWSGEKNSSTLTKCSGKDDSSLVSQAQTLLDLFHEVFKTSNTPLQVVLEPQKSADVRYLDKKIVAAEGHHPTKESFDHKSVPECPSVRVVNHEKRSNISKLEHGYSQQNCEEVSTIQLIHRCYYCSFGSDAVSLVFEHIKNHHPNKQLRTKTISGRNCPYCNLRLEQTAFFQHMRQYHGDAHPFRCGYCSFMGRDLNQVKHHCSKKHPHEPFKCFRRSNVDSSALQSSQDGLQSKDSMEEKDDNKNKDLMSGNFREEGELLQEVETKGGHDCPVCKKEFKTLKYLKVHMRVHSKVRFKCGYCSYLSVYFLQVFQHCKKRHKMLQPRVKQHDLDPSQNTQVVKNVDSYIDEVLKKGSRQPADPDTRKWARKYSCPHCEYTCSYGASFRRHLTLHSSRGLPFRCKYCPYKGREKYYVRRHIQRVHRDHPQVVVENEPGDLTLNSDVGFSNSQKVEEAKVLKIIKSGKKSTPKNQVLSQCKTASSVCKEVSGEGSVGLDLGKLVQELNSSSEDFRDEGVEELKKKKQGSDPGDNNCFKALIDGEVDVECKKISEGNILVEEMVYTENNSNEKEVTHILSRNEVYNMENIQCNKRRKSIMKKHDPKMRPVIKNSLENKIPFLIPKLLPSSEDKVNEISKRNPKHVDKQEKKILINDLSSKIEAVEMNPGKSLDENLMENSKESSSKASESNKSKLEDNVPPETSVVVETMLVCKKKRKKVNSTHKIKKFLARKEGKHSYCICGTRTVNKAFYKHIKKHMDFKPYGCGYCYYRSIEKAKVRVHHAFVHSGVPLIIKEYWDSKQKDLDDSSNENMSLELRTSKLEMDSNISPEKGSEKVSAPRKSSNVDFNCPICDKKISFHSYTIKRHIFAHYDYRPYQCGQCDFRGCSPGEVKQHSVYHGPDISPVVLLSGQQPPDGLEQLVESCIKSKLLGNATKRKAKSGYKLITKEAISWQKSLSQGRCPWCKLCVLSPESETAESQPKNDIESHFRSHFYKSMENKTENSGLEGITIPDGPPSTIEEKDSVIMSGLISYFIHQPVVKDLEMEYPKDTDGSERGIIFCPDGMPEGTIQIADTLLADLRHLLWGQEDKPSSRKSKKSCQKQELNSSSVEVVGLNSEELQKLDDDHQLQTSDSRIKQYPLWGIIEANQNLLAQEGEVGVILLSDEIEMTTAVVVVDPEAKESTDVEVDVSI